MSTQTAKGADSRQRLLNAAMKLFAENGFHGTTMRAIALESGLSLGNTYYYFESKDQLVSELFRLLQDEQRALTWPRLTAGNNLETNVRLTLETTIDVLAPYRDFGPAFIRAAFAGGNEASGFVNRAKEFGLWRQAVATSRPQPPLAIRQDLPQLLWLIQRGIILFWAYDNTENARRTRRLIGNAAPVIARLAVLSRLPVVRTILDDIISLIRTSN